MHQNTFSRKCDFAIFERLVLMSHHNIYSITTAILGFMGQHTTLHNAPSQKSILYKISNNTLNIGRKLILIVFE